MNLFLQRAFNKSDLIYTQKKKKNQIIYVKELNHPSGKNPSTAFYNMILKTYPEYSKPIIRQYPSNPNLT